MFKENQNIFIYKGLFPKENSNKIKEKKFSFVHLDVDLYQGTKDSLEFFYPRMIPGGAILIHDYHHFSDGVKNAVDNFIINKPEILIEPVDKYALIIKL